MHLITFKGGFGMDRGDGTILLWDKQSIGITKCLKSPPLPFSIDFGESFKHDGFLMINNTLYAKQKDCNLLYFIDEEGRLTWKDSDPQEALLIIPEEGYVGKISRS